MLIRPTGRHDGVKNYLEDGRKKDREHSRDQLDERVILAGDLEVTDAIIQSIQAAPEVERYLHITLSFKEDDVPLEQLYAAVEDFRKFVYAAYHPDELNFYAEAHVPKLKSYADRKSGAPVERKPHVHIVVPKMNLLTGGSADPFGYAKSNISYIDAIQEQLNAKYGFASPKENRRTQLTDSSEMISRYKGDLFANANRDLKTSLLDAVLDQKIERYEDFVELLEKHGVTRLRNAGQASEYPNVKLPGDAKGINLKETVFSREFMVLPTATKLEQLGAEVKSAYVISGDKRESSAAISATVDEWFATRARETKYLNSGNKSAYEAYKAGSPSDRLKWLDERERAFYTKHQGAENESGSTSRSSSDERGDRRLRRIGRIYEFKRGPARATDGLVPAERGPTASRTIERFGRSVERTDGQPIRRRPSVADAKRWEWSAGRGASGSSAKTLNGVRSLSGLPVVRFKGGSKVLLPNHAPGVVEHQRAERSDSLRRDRDRQRDVKPVVARWERRYPLKMGVVSGSLEGDTFQSSANKRMPAKRLTGGLTPSVAPVLAADDQVRKRLRRGARDDRWRGREVRSNGRLSDSVVSQQRRDIVERRERHEAERHPDYAEIRNSLSARRLLGELSHSHGVLPEKYAVIRTRDGSERIKVGSRHLNVSDFLTKELNLPWKEAGPMLRDAYARQQGKTIELPVRERPRAVLWQGYSKAREDMSKGRRSAWSEQREGEQRRRAQIKTDFEARRETIRTEPSLSMRQRRSSLSVARMERVGSETSLRDTIVLERAALQAKHGSAAGMSFANYLKSRAQAGDTLALSELRRTRRLHGKKNELANDRSQENEIRPIDLQRNEIIYQRAALIHQIHDNGDVAYRRQGQDVVRDRGLNILVLQRDRETVETGLRLAMAKFGSTLELAGDETFKREAARVAADVGLNVRFSDDGLNQLMTQTRAQKIADRYTTTTLTREVPVSNTAVLHSRSEGIDQTHEYGGQDGKPKPSAPSR